MAKACRRFTAGERATASRVRTKHRGDTRQQEDHEVCKRDSPQELIDKAKLKGNRTQKYLRAIRLLVAPTTCEGNGVGGGGRVAVCRGASIPILNKGGTQCGM